MYERFTDRARKVMQLANQEAQRFNHEYIGTEHVLLGLIKEGSGTAAAVLERLNVDRLKVRFEVERLIEPGPEMVTMGKLPQTLRTKKVIEYSMEEARNLNHNYVGTEHFLLGLLREQEGIAARVLMNFQVTVENARDHVLKLLGPGINSGSALRQPMYAARDSIWAEDPLPMALPQTTVPEYERLQCASILQGQRIQIQRGTGLVLMPSRAEFEQVLESAIRPALCEANITGRVAAENYTPGPIVSQVWECIRSSEVIIADVSGQNANVMFELGLCFAAFRFPIVLVRQKDDLPVNLQALRHVIYEPTEQGLARLKEELASTILAFLSAARGSSSKVLRPLGDWILKGHGVPMLAECLLCAAILCQTATADAVPDHVRKYLARCEQAKREAAKTGQTASLARLPLPPAKDDVGIFEPPERSTARGLDVLEIVDGDNAVVRAWFVADGSRPGDIAAGEPTFVDLWIGGVDTKGFATDRPVSLPGVFHVTGYKSFGTTCGSRSLPHLQPIDIERYRAADESSNK